MKKIENRAFVCLLLALALGAGMILFLFRYLTQGGSWASSAFNRHLYNTQGQLTAGTVLDRDGDVLSWAEFAVLGTAVSALLAPLCPEGFPEVFRLFCENLEHSEGNMAAVQDGLWDRVELGEMLAVAVV